MFDPTAARLRVEKMWKLGAHFGEERGLNRMFLDEIVSDRMQLVSGLQILRDELQFAELPAETDREACSADLSLPSVVTTQAVTNCGDRIHQGEVENYVQVVGARFATLSEVGTLKVESFHPTGGGTDDGATLAHVTWAHALDDPLRKRIYEGNRQSYVLCAFDLKTHVGRLDEDDKPPVFGRTQESPWRQPRAACGAIVGALTHFDSNNDVHRRLRKDLGEDNFALLSGDGMRTADGIEITSVVAAAIIAVRGMLDTARALTREMDKRGLAHLTASITVNRPSMPDTLIYLARATVFHGEIAIQGFGTDARKYAGDTIRHRSGDHRLRLSHAGQAGGVLPIERSAYEVRKEVGPIDIFA
jgi:hypothetical protein